MQDTVASQNKTTQGQLAQLLQEFAGQTAETKSTAPKIAQSDAEKGKIANTINSTNTTAFDKSSNATILSIKNVDDAVLKQMNESAAQQETANQSNDGNAENSASFAAQLTKADNAAQVLTNGVQSNAQPQQSQNAYDIGGQIIRNAQLLKGNENSQMVINLQPEHLGELAVKINVHSDGMVSASFHSDNAQVRNVIQASIVQLRQDLQDQGIKVDNINVYSGLSDLLSNGQNNNGSEFTGDQKKSQYRIQQLMDATGQMEESGIVDNIASQQNNADDGIDYRI
ncbi:flagellar hook-length control protein FliK [Pectinatus brassicae]|uniref:Flagellar hook-length control protein FliK n=4 Tax=Pectinatus brassicae TaxID=862415 RepID=A0A840UVV9_9FIRM|nr:flagellar hook-length control protein FliK [Pectinatus brassicae]